MATSSSCSFRDLNLEPAVLAAIDALGFEEPTPIQRQAIPLLLDGHDLIGKAQTGTGKTLAFLAPMIGKIETARVSVQGLVLCPTRELAQQVADVADQLGGALGLRTALLVGGVHQSGQILSLREGAQIVVGTPGRILEMIQERYLNLGWTHQVVLDEADRMLDMGFIADVMSILKQIPSERQMMLFSATVPSRLERLTRDFMNDPKSVETTKGNRTIKRIRQTFVHLHPRDKERFLFELFDENPDDTCIVFCNTRRAVKELDRTLWGLGYPAAAIHGDQEQEQRFRVLDSFKDRQIMTLVATDVAARGLDIDSVTRIINYDVPDEVDTYIHRIGRTGRAGEVGETITLVTRHDERSWDAISRLPQFECSELEWRRPRRGTPSRGSSRSDRGRPRTDERRTSAQPDTRKASTRKADTRKADTRTTTTPVEAGFVEDDGFAPAEVEAPAHDEVSFDEPTGQGSFPPPTALTEPPRESRSERTRRRYESARARIRERSEAADAGGRVAASRTKADRRGDEGSARERSDPPETPRESGRASRRQSPSKKTRSKSRRETTRSESASREPARSPRPSQSSSDDGGDRQRSKRRRGGRSRDRDASRASDRSRSRRPSRTRGPDYHMFDVSDDEPL